MRASTTAFVLAGAATAAAQIQLPAIIQNLSFSTQCQQALLQALSAPAAAQCLPVAGLLPAITSNSSVIPALDDFMSSLCYSAPCSNETVSAAVAAINQGCAADIQASGLPNNTVEAAFSLYPTVREVLCLKTSEPYNEDSYSQYEDGSLGPAPIPITEYNSTGGYFCVSSVLTQLSAYYDANLTVPFVTSIVSGANQTALDLTKAINPNIVCNECIFGALDIIQLAYPIAGNTPINYLAAYANISIPINQTINELANGECEYIPLVVSANGTLPDTISVSIVNSTFPFTVTNGDQ